jgi:hypothetical protein
MNKQLPLITSVLLVLGSSVAALAAPVSVDATEGLLASPAAQPPVQDPVIQKALEWIQNKQMKPSDLQKKNGPEKTIGQKPDYNHRLILGGPENIPM